MKIAVIIFHKKPCNYPTQWIEKCMSSIRNQTYSDFDVFELDYGGEGIQLYKGSFFQSLIMNDHAQAHNHLLDTVFDRGYDGAFNVNIDDWYSLDRFERQLPYLAQGYDVISSDFRNVDEGGRVICDMVMHEKNIQVEASNDHNIIAHPVLLYSRKFWTTCSKLKSEEIPRDDFELWKRSFKDYRFVVVPEFLLNYRIHKNKVS